MGMRINKRDFIKLSGAGMGTVMIGGCESAESSLKSMLGDVVPISVNERLLRIEKAQRLMAENNIDAILLEPGSAMLYFAGISWWRSERLTAVLIPRDGDIGIVTPFFEEPSVRESMTFGDDVRAWHEHDSPYQKLAGLLADRSLRSGRIGLEGTVRHFVAEGILSAIPNFKVVSAEPITRGCRMFKSANEINLMRKANAITLAAYEHTYSKLQVGMQPSDVNELMQKAQTSLGGSDVWSMALFGVASAYPHGTQQPQKISDGQIVLMDCGCAVEGYQSDISRTFVFGDASVRQREVWETVRLGQDIAFGAAQVGATAGSVDDKVREYYESLGWGPGYALPGLSHRTGHGIGMDGHESINFVHGEQTKLAPGMCFSNEPGLYDFASFGVRLEDCLYITEDGPEWFTVPPDNIDEPISGRLG